MVVATKALRIQLALMKSLTNSCTLDTARSGQSMLGTLMAQSGKSKVVYKPQIFKNFIGEWIVPKYQKLDGIILYLHGGGYVAGDIDYAKGFGTILCERNGIQVFSVGYRLAPEHPFPKGLEDTVEAYKFLLARGYKPSQIVLCGESAGGGLIYSLCLKLKEKHIKLPAGLIAVSPWVDLTLSGVSINENADSDVALTGPRLDYYAQCYTNNDYELRKNPLVSPLFSDMKKLPPSLIFAGGGEILLDDSVRLDAILKRAKVDSCLEITPKMWHVYILYGIREAKKDFESIQKFLYKVLKDEN